MQISIGAPKFRLPYELAAAIGALAPYGLFKIEDWDRFEPLYRERLDRFGVEAIKRALVAIARLYDAPGVVLLCFEDLTKGLRCHRRIFAAWWEEQTGELVEEL